MNRTTSHAVIVWTLLAALCGLCAVQWLREAGLQNQIETLQGELHWHQSELATQQSQLDIWRHEIESLTAKVAQISAHAEQREQRLRAERDELASALSQARGQQIAVEQATNRITRANETIQAQADRIDELLERLEQHQATVLELRARRDDLARQLNQRTEAYNALVQRLRDS